jgi:hypothetical protein
VVRDDQVGAGVQCLGDGLRDAVDDAEHPVHGAVRLTEDEADAIPVLRPRRRISLLQSGDDTGDRDLTHGR